MIKLSWGTFSPYIIFLYILFGAGSELYMAYKTHHVAATFPFILFSALIFICRIGYAIESKASKNLKVDIFGALTMILLAALKFLLT